MEFKTLEEQIAGRCIHFTGIMNESCDAGIRYETVRANGFNIPCLKSCNKLSKQCSKCHFPSMEEAEIQAQEMNKEAAKTFSVFRFVKEYADSNSVREGTVECPLCEKELNFSILGDEDHLHFKCSGCGANAME